MSKNLLPDEWNENAYWAVVIADGYPQIIKSSSSNMLAVRLRQIIREARETDTKLYIFPFAGHRGGVTNGHSPSLVIKDCGGNMEVTPIASAQEEEPVVSEDGLISFNEQKNSAYEQQTLEELQRAAYAADHPEGQDIEGELTEEVP